MEDTNLRVVNNEESKTMCGRDTPNNQYYFHYLVKLFSKTLNFLCNEPA